jgi:hypothetical protein
MNVEANQQVVLTVIGMAYFSGGEQRGRVGQQYENVYRNMVA